MDFKEYFSYTPNDILYEITIQEVYIFIFQFISCSVMCFFMGKLYVKYGQALSNRESFASNFLIFGVSVMFIISIVKTSLALSLGLVGALSIVRFRSAIKEPEELIYLFVVIAIGLGTGAGLTIYTIIAFLGFCLIILINSKLIKKENGQTLYISISSDQEVQIDEIVDILKTYSEKVKLKRSDSNSLGTEFSFLVEFSNFQNISNFQKAIKGREKFNISFIDNARDF